MAGKRGRPPSRKCLSDALRIAVNEPGENGGKKVRDIANKLLEKALEGDMAAIKEVFDRLEGKAMQPIGGDEEAPPVQLMVNFIRRLEDVV